MKLRTFLFQYALFLYLLHIHPVSSSHSPHPPASAAARLAAARQRSLRVQDSSNPHSPDCWELRLPPLRAEVSSPRPATPPDTDFEASDGNMHRYYLVLYSVKEISISNLHM